jgi:hypothetical protein
MGLTMRQKRAVTGVTARRYRKADKAGKKRILDELTQTTGYNRKYAIHLLATWGKETVQLVDGAPVRLVVGAHRKRTPRVRPRRYGEPVRQALAKIWELFDYMCGKRAGGADPAEPRVAVRPARVGHQRGGTPGARHGQPGHYRTPAHLRAQSHDPQGP